MRISKKMLESFRIKLQINIKNENHVLESFDLYTLILMMRIKNKREHVVTSFGSLMVEDL